MTNMKLNIEPSLHKTTEIQEIKTKYVLFINGNRDVMFIIMLNI